MGGGADLSTTRQPESQCTLFAYHFRRIGRRTRRTRCEVGGTLRSGRAVSHAKCRQSGLQRSGKNNAPSRARSLRRRRSKVRRPIAEFCSVTLLARSNPPGTRVRRNSAWTRTLSRKPDPRVTHGHRRRALSDRFAGDRCQADHGSRSAFSTRWSTLIVWICIRTLRYLRAPQPACSRI